MNKAFQDVRERPCVSTNFGVCGALRLLAGTLILSAAIRATSAADADDSRICMVSLSAAPTIPADFKDCGPDDVVMISGGAGTAGDLLGAVQRACRFDRTIKLFPHDNPTLALCVYTGKLRSAQ